MKNDETNFSQKIKALLFWAVVTYCIFYFIPGQFKFQYNYSFIDDLAPSLKWLLILIPFILLGIKSVLSRNNEENED